MDDTMKDFLIELYIKFGDRLFIWERESMIYKLLEQARMDGYIKASPNPNHVFQYNQITPAALKLIRGNK